MELLDYPSEKTFAKRIRKLGAFQIYASRWGIDKAWKKFQFVTLGLDVTAPGQRIEIDAWEIHLQALLIVAGVWDKLPKKLKKAIERGRLIICVAIDAASRAILGMAIARGAETAELGVRCLNMVVRDKKPFADAVGAFTPWNMCCPLHEIGVDQGVFTKDTFQRTVLALKGDVAHPAAGRAQDRARIERFFKTIDQRLMGFFTGRTFSNPVENGDYPNKARASITEEELYWVLVRYVVDVYHNTPHEGLNGETPYNAWHRLVREYGLKRLPDVDTLRNTFGVRMTRILSPKGVRFMNIFYHSTALHQIFTQYSRGKKVDIIVDTADLGAISVRIPNTDDWITVPAITRNIDLNGVSLEEWTTTCNALLARFGDQAKISEKIVLQTLREIIALSETAVKRAVIGATTLTPEQINSAERKLLIAWNSKQVGDANPEAGGDIFATAIPALPESGGTPQAAPHDDDAAPAAARDGDAANGDDEDADRATGDAIDPRDEEWGSDEWGFED
jgi:putative transposase